MSVNLMLIALVDLLYKALRKRLHNISLNVTKMFIVQIDMLALTSLYPMALRNIRNGTPGTCGRV